MTLIAKILIELWSIKRFKKVIAFMLVLTFTTTNIVFAKSSKKEIKPMKKIVQTAGRTQLGEFALEFTYYNDDVLFG